MITAQGIYRVLFGLTVIATVGFIGNKIIAKIDTKKTDEYDLIKKYLLNDSPLYGYNKPKIWIHSKYEINARQWKDFYSRNSTDLNQPYIHLTIQSIINHCGNDFHICLIDDETFSKLIPTWDIDLPNIAEPAKSNIRELGLAQLIYYYGGMVVPNSFLCSQNLLGLYSDGISNMLPFACENINHTQGFMDKQKLIFSPDSYFYGAPKNNKTIQEYIEVLKTKCNNSHFNGEYEFRGQTNNLFRGFIGQQKMNLIGGELVGIKNDKRKPILIEELLGEGFIHLSPNIYGIYIPQEEILKRTKYQWFATISTEQLLNTNILIAKYMRASMVDFSSEYVKTNGKEIKSIISI
jgi:hypothetical protein